ncbi:MAG: sulfatase [Pirellulaceae bacterium]|nr:N-acetylgalactosamine 6-sulfate sulfatase (GALNS) [Planctomycetota bacterium]MDP6556600.1 sulfatase [Pirellulaceae bacterium]
MRVLILFAVAVMAPALVLGAERPNVVFILADDLGWSDTTLYGTTKFYQTPNIERLARRGATFTRAYSASPLCSPTRASILSGLSPARHGITSPTCHLPKVVLEATPGTRAAPDQKAVPVNSVTRLSTEYQTLPKSLKAAGYATGHFGKWHLGHEPYSPLEHGFDVDVPHHPGPGPAGSYVAPWKFRDFDHDPDVPDQHIEDRMAAEAVRWMEQHSDEPFFLNYWMFSVHAPFDAKRRLIEKHRKRVEPKTPQRSPTYAAMIESMDDAVGTLLDALDRLKIADRTIIVFASDNGGNMYNEVDGTTPTSNAPLRGGKATMFEGGVRGPAVVVWPGVVERGSRSDAVIQSCDFYPTLLNMLDIEPQLGQTVDGISIVPALKGKALRRDAIFTYFPHAPRVPDWLPPAVSVHRGDWKLIRVFHGSRGGGHDYKLFNLRDDEGETRNLAAAQPDRVKELDGLIERFLDDTNAVRPTRNPNFDPSKFRPELIGQPRRKPSAPANRRGIPKPVAGWLSSRDCKLAVREGTLIVTSSGKDPWLSSALPKSLSKGDYVLELTMSSNGSGRGQLFWQEQEVQPKFFRARSVTFAMTHDGKTHAYRIPFSSAHSVPSVRVDPGQGPGEMRIIEMRLVDVKGHVEHAWRF